MLTLKARPREKKGERERTDKYLLYCNQTVNMEPCLLNSCERIAWLDGWLVGWFQELAS